MSALQICRLHFVHQVSEVGEGNKYFNICCSLFNDLFKTQPGFTEKHKGDRRMMELTNHVKEYFTNLSREEEGDHNLTLVDWGAVIQKRSYRKKRIKGDITVHYGLEARLLFAQQLLHELLAAEQRKV